MKKLTLRRFLNGDLGCELKVAGYGFRVEGCELRVLSCGLKVAGCGLFLLCLLVFLCDGLFLEV
jgi:hypothetical protein